MFRQRTFFRPVETRFSAEQKFDTSPEGRYIAVSFESRWGRSSDWLERRPVKPEVASSSLVAPAISTQNNRIGGPDKLHVCRGLWSRFFLPS